MIRQDYASKEHCITRSTFRLSLYVYDLAVQVRLVKNSQSVFCKVRRRFFWGDQKRTRIFCSYRP